MECAMVVGICGAAISHAICGHRTYGEVIASRSWVFMLPLYGTRCRYLNATII